MITTKDLPVRPAPDYLHDDCLSRGTREYLKQLNASPVPVESLSPVDARRVLSDLQMAVPVDLSGVEEEPLAVHAEGYDLSLRCIRPRGDRRILPAFLFLHGGGWVLGDYPTHQRLVRDLVVASGCAALFVDYTPSPEARFPQALEEIYAALKWCAMHGDGLRIDPARLALVGNSVGANMAVVTAMRAAAENSAPLKTLLLLWPVTDASEAWESYARYGRQRFLTAPLMRWMFECYTADHAARNSLRISPLRAPLEALAGLPPTLIAVAENDILRDQGEAFGRRLDEAGVEVTTVRFNGVIHDWGMLNGFAALHPSRMLTQFVVAALRTALCDAGAKC